MRTSKKAFAIFSVLAMVMALSVSAFAVETEIGPEYEISVVGEEAIANLQKTGALRTTNNLTEIASKDSEIPQYEITVSGQENINAYVKAGILNTSEGSATREMERGTAKPTSVWNLDNQGCRTTTYSMSTWIYSGYQYDSGSYKDIWHTIYPNQVQKMTIQCYKANGTAWGNGHVSDYSDEEYAYGIATGNGVKVYFTYTSTNGKLISGNMDIC